MLSRRGLVEQHQQGVHLSPFRALTLWPQIHIRFVLAAPAPLCADVQCRQWALDILGPLSSTAALALVEAV